MKLLGYLVSASIFSNVYVLWRLDEQSTAPATTSYGLEVTPQDKTITVFKDEKKEVDIAPLQIQIAELNARLEAMERNIEESSDSDEQITGTSDRNTQMERVTKSFTNMSNSTSDEEWFWMQGGGEEESSLSFSQSDGFTVNSVVCKSEWCRVEIENTSGGDDNLISDLELQLKINESLGRDTAIRSGERNGSHRVLFIQ